MSLYEIQMIYSIELYDISNIIILNAIYKIV